MSYPPPGDQLQPELADVFRLGRRLVRRTVAAARAEDQPLRRLLYDHLRPGAASMPTVSGSWLQYDHVNVQVGLDAWLARPGRQHELVGITGFRHSMFGLGELVEPADGGFRLWRAYALGGSGQVKGVHGRRSGHSPQRADAIAQSMTTVPLIPERVLWAMKAGSGYRGSAEPKRACAGA